MLRDAGGVRSYGYICRGPDFIAVRSRINFLRTACQEAGYFAYSVNVPITQR